jgi:hypothetical protein
LRIPDLLELHAIAVPEALDAAPVIGKIVSLCLQFWHDSEMWLGRAVTETSAALGGNRIRFAVPQFTEKNSVFASDPWLWGINLDLSPQDEVSATRIPACDLFYKDKPEDILSCLECHRASVGHPNVSGASAFADAIKLCLP